MASCDMSCDIAISSEVVSRNGDILFETTRRDTGMVHTQSVLKGACVRKVR